MSFLVHYFGSIGGCKKKQLSSDTKHLDGNQPPLTIKGLVSARMALNTSLPAIIIGISRSLF